MSREAMKLALEALKQIDEAMPFPVAKLAQAALREALAQERSSDEQPEPSCPECVLGLCHCGLRKAEQPIQQRTEELLEIFKDVDQCGPLLGMGQPAQRKPLTPEWIWTWLMDWCKRNGSSPANYNSLFKMVADARAIEAAHGIKENT